MRIRLKPTLTFLSSSLTNFGGVFAPTLLTSAVLMSLVACGSKWHEVAQAPNTGDKFAEQQLAPEPAHPLRTGDPGFVSTTHLPARTSKKQPSDEAPAHLERNDKIQVIDPAPQGADGSMEVVVSDTRQPDMKDKHYFVAKAYIADKPVVPSNDEKDAEKYFMVQNIATERLRVYLNCASKDAAGNCVHKMVFETEMLAGQNTPDKSRQTILGSYHIEKWFKFYEDHHHDFPAFYDPTYPNTPDRNNRNATLQDWMSPSVLPPKGGVMRGSFGWYTAYLEPNAMDQWTHGTFGWGADGEKYIEAVKDPAYDNISDVHSQGCTRVENRAIALMREILPEGTLVVKVYAREGYADKTLAGYKTSAPAKWNFILTKKRGDDAPKSGVKFTKGSGSDEILDQGTYVLDQTPTAVAIDPSEIENGNIYDVPASQMKGVFLVDEGRLVSYEHPAALKIGGMGGKNDHSLPSLLISTRLPKPVVAKAEKPAEKSADQPASETSAPKAEN